MLFAYDKVRREEGMEGYRELIIDGRWILGRADDVRN
jgi:hypothetical protein